MATGAKSKSKSAAEVGQLDTVMQEARLFPPPAEFAAKSRIKSLAEYEAMWREAAGDIEKFWSSLAGELHWFEPFTKTLEWNEPFAKWFVGGKTNASYNCLDAHLSTARRNKAAIIWEGEPGEERTLTYQQLHREVCKFATVLKSLGLKKGDVASLYMPLVPELAIAMLACARIGVVHSVIFGGFSSEAIAERNNDAKAKLIITADEGWRRGQQLPLKANVDAALVKSPTVKNCIVLRRAGVHVHMQEGRDHWWHDLMEDASADCQRFDRQTQRDQAHHGRLQSVCQEIVRMGVRLSRRRFVLVHRRHWLGHRAQLCGIRTTFRGRHRADVRRSPELARRGALLAADRKIPRQHFLHGPHGNSLVHQMG
jgi:hypothetical protein